MRFQPLIFCMASMPAIAYAQMPPDHHTNFSESCGPTSLIESGTVLKSACCFGQCAASMVVSNKLDLNRCLGVDDAGKLLFKAGGEFSKHCGKCSLGEAEKALTCECKPSAGSGAVNTVNSTLDLDTGIGNNGGILRCDGGSAEIEYGGPYNY